MSILDANGEPLKRNTETTFPLRLMEMLIALEDLLKQNGIGLFCLRCHALGMADGIMGDSTATKYSLKCGCANRVFDLTTGKEQVRLQ